MSSYDLTEAVEAARSALNDRGGHGFRVRPESMVPYCLCGWSADHSLDVAAHDRHIAEVVLTAALPHLEQQTRERVAAEAKAEALRDFADAMERDDWTHRDDWGVNCAYSFEVRTRADALEAGQS